MGGIIMGALGGAGEALGQMGSAMFKDSLDRDSRQQESDTSLQRAKALEEFRQNLQNAPLKRFEGYVASAREKEVPTEVAPVRALDGTTGLITTDGNAPQSRGFAGDPATVYKSLMALPEGPDKAAALAQFEAQLTAEQKRNLAAAEGKTRKRTNAEALAAASEQAMTSDLPALAAFESTIGKPMRDERRVDLAAEREENRARAAGAAEERRAAADARRAEVEAIKLELQQRGLDIRDRQVSAMIERLAGGGPEKAPNGYRWKADGGLEFIPGGPADPTSKPAGGKPLNEGQSKALLFGARMQASNEILEDLQKQGRTLSTPGAQSYGAVNALNSTQGQLLDQAKRDFVNAVLRRESGAVISDAEFANAEKQYFPQFGESEKVIEQKRKNRELATRGILAEVPDAETHLGRVRAEGAARRSEPASSPSAAPKGWSIRPLAPR